MKNLHILWQSLVSQQGISCPRCHSTGEQVQRDALVPLMKNEPVGVQRLSDLAGHCPERV
jgi:hypothetical protein